MGPRAAFFTASPTASSGYGARACWFCESGLGEYGLASVFGDGFAKLGLRGVKRIVANPGTGTHRRYLLGIEFTDDGASLSRSVA